METAINTYKILASVNFYIEVTIACLGCYFLARNIWAWDKPKASYVVIGISFVGQLAFSALKDMQDVFMVITMGIVQSVVAIGLYSFLDSYGIWDKLGKLAGKKIDEKIGGDNTSNPPAVPA